MIDSAALVTAMHGRWTLVHDNKGSHRVDRGHVLVEYADVRVGTSTASAIARLSASRKSSDFTKAQGNCHIVLRHVADGDPWVKVLPDVEQLKKMAHIGNRIVTTILNRHFLNHHLLKPSV